MNLICAFRRLVFRLFFSNSSEHFMCDLCCRTTHHTQASGYYDDVSACLICCPAGFSDPDAEAGNEGN